MAAGIIDHETGTRDIRRLSGLFRLMPITATLAMVAAAAMAGVPLLNGFLSKEMFFAEALEVEGRCHGSIARCRIVATRGGDVQRRVFAAFHPRRVLRAAADGPAARAARAAALGALSDRAARARVRGRRRASRRRRSARCSTSRSARCSAPRTPAYSLALWHGFTVPLLMSMVALAGGFLLLPRAAPCFARGDERTPLLPPIDARRVFDAVLVALSWRWARALCAGSAPSGCSRSCAGSCCWRIAAPLWPVSAWASTAARWSRRRSKRRSRSPGWSARAARWPRRGRRNSTASPRSCSRRRRAWSPASRSYGSRRPISR